MIYSSPIILISAILFSFLLTGNVFALDVKGYVYDKNTGEQLIGATVLMAPGSKKEVTSFSGK